MSYKTERLANLFPDAYAVQDTQSLLYRLLDALGAELYEVDQQIKALLKSHWVNYAEDQALDGLGAIYGVKRRRLPDGTREPDDAFRLRLKSIVTLFQGGGTVEAVKGAVRSALGLPFNLKQLNLPDRLRQDLENLVVLEEFSPQIDRFLGLETASESDSPRQLQIEISQLSARAAPARIEWRFSRGAGRRLVLERHGTSENSPIEPEGIRSRDDLLIPPEATLILSAAVELMDENQAVSNPRFTAQLIQRNPDGSESRTDVSDQFVNSDGSTPAQLPNIPPEPSQWSFQAQGGLFDISTFDNDTFDLPEFTVELQRVRLRLLTFDVRVPYLIEDAVQAIADRHNYQGNLFVFQGLRPEQIPAVVEQTQAAGVRGHVNFSLNFLEIHNQDDTLRWVGRHQVTEDANAADTFQIGSFKRNTESHNMTDRFAIGGLFDVATFDSDFGFF